VARPSSPSNSYLRVPSNNGEEPAWRRTGEEFFLTEGEYSLFLNLGAWVCALGAGFNLFKLKSRGNAAFILSTAFIVMGGLLLLIRVHADQKFISVGAVALASLLVADVIVRSRTRERQR